MMMIMMVMTIIDLSVKKTQKKIKSDICHLLLSNHDHYGEYDDDADYDDDYDDND